MADELIFERASNGLLRQVAPDNDASGRSRHAIHGQYFVLFTAEEELAAQAADQKQLEEMKERQAKERIDTDAATLMANTLAKARESALSKLRAFGLTDEEINAMFGR